MRYYTLKRFRNDAVMFVIGALALGWFTYHWGRLDLFFAITDAFGITLAARYGSYYNYKQQLKKAKVTDITAATE